MALAQALPGMFLVMAIPQTRMLPQGGDALPTAFWKRLIPSIRQPSWWVDLPLTGLWVPQRESTLTPQALAGLLISRQVASPGSLALTLRVTVLWVIPSDAKISSATARRPTITPY